MKNNILFIIAIVVCYLLSYFSSYVLSLILTVLLICFFSYQLIRKIVEYKRVQRSEKINGQIIEIKNIERDEDGNDRVAIIEFISGQSKQVLEYKYSHILKSKPNDLRVFVNPQKPEKSILMEDYHKTFISSIINSVIFIIIALAFLVYSKWYV